MRVGSPARFATDAMVAHPPCLAKCPLSQPRHFVTIQTTDVNYFSMTIAAVYNVSTYQNLESGLNQHLRIVF